MHIYFLIFERNFGCQNSNSGPREGPKAAILLLWGTLWCHMWIERQVAVFFGTFFGPKLELNWSLDPFRFVIIFLKTWKSSSRWNFGDFLETHDRKSKVFDREVLQKSEFGTIEYSIPEKLILGAFWTNLGVQFWLQKVSKLVPQGNQKMDPILGQFFGVKSSSAAGYAGPSLRA